MMLSHQAISFRTVVLFFLMTALLSGCSKPVELKNLAKTDTDLVADTCLRELNRLTEDLLVKLYKRNPRELKKISGMTISRRKEQVFGTPGRLVFAELDRRQGTDALNLAFDASYNGDRVFAIMAGLVGMIRSSYNWQEEQFMFDSLNEQTLFNSARNLEVLAWRLSNSRDENGDLLVLTNSLPGEETNLSYERLFGKMIAIQDTMALIIADKWNRGINFVVLKAAFLPMGL